MFFKFTNSNYLLDLSSYKFSQTEKNYWFSNNFFTKYTFPIDIEIDDELNVLLGYPLDHNSSTVKSYLEGWFFHDGKHEEAVLEVQDIEGTTATVNIRFGFDELPNWDTKLSELPLEETDLAVNLTEHAATVLDLQWPDTNYNFPVLHTDLYDTDADEWVGFDNKINNYESGAFVENEFDSTDNEYYNYNVMQPLPHLFHVLQVAFENAGYVLAGDILSVEKLKNAWIYSKSDYYSNSREESFEIGLMLDDIESTFLFENNYNNDPYDYYNQTNSVSITMANYNSITTFSANGNYKVAGNVHIRRKDSYVMIKFLLNNVVVQSYTYQTVSGPSYQVVTLDFDIMVNDYTTDDLEIRCECRPFESTSNLYSQGEGYIVDVTVTPLEVFDASGNLVPAILGANKIDLTKCVPDMSVGDLITALRNYINIGLEIKGEFIYMNLINEHVDRSEALDLSNYEIKKLKRTLNNGTSYELKFKEIDNANYNYLPVFVNINGMVTSSYSTDDNTTITEINVLPLPLDSIGGLTTAFTAHECTDRLGLVFYDGMIDNINKCLSSGDMLLPNIYEVYWRSWLSSRISASVYKWSFYVKFLNVQNLTAKSVVFAYNRYHLVKNIQKTNMSMNVYDIELEVETI